MFPSHSLARLNSTPRQRLGRLGHHESIADLRIRRVQSCPHNINNELIFSRHDGYVFHDSCGFQAGGEYEKKVVQDFLGRRLRERKLRNRLHVIWFVPLGNIQSQVT
jgi:hypothetical protein